MSYVEDNLISGETVLYRSTLHWIIFAWPAFWILVSIVSFAEGFGGAGVLIILIGILVGLSAFLTYKTSEFAITNKRVIVKVGFIRTNSIEVLLNKVEGIQVNQDIFGTIFGFGSITVTGTGGTKDPFYKISDPMEFRKQAQMQIAVVQDSK